MAVSGLALTAFAITHLTGNLVIYLGQETFNGYSKKLRDLGMLLWLARGVLLAALVVHVWSAVQLSRENRRARPVPYRRRTEVQTTLAAKIMMVTGLLLLAYIVYHVMHFTFRVTDPLLAHLTFHGGHDTYTMVVRGFQRWPVSCVYIAAMGMLCLHLSHGLASSFQSLGLNNERTLPVLRRVSYAVAIALFLGYSSVPVAVLSGWLRAPGGF